MPNGFVASVVGCWRDCVYRIWINWVCGFCEERAMTHNEEGRLNMGERMNEKRGKGRLREEILEKKREINFTKKIKDDFNVSL